MSQPKLNFTTEEDDKLVEAVSAHPAVYDLKHALYKDQRAKDHIWIEIGEEVGRSVGDCKKRWKNIKDTFERKNRVINKTGPTAPPFKKGKTWALQERLSFLRTLDGELETHTNIVEEFEWVDAIKTELDNEVVPEQKTRETSFTSQPQSTSSTGRTHCKTTQRKSLENNEKTNYRDTMCLTMEKRAKKRNIMMKKLLAKDDEQDDISLFFQSIAKTVQKFPPHLQQRAKLETLQLVSHIETDMWSSHPETRTQLHVATSPSPLGSVYSDMSRPPSTSNQSERSVASSPGHSPELYSQHPTDIRIRSILGSATNNSDPTLD